MLGIERVDKIGNFLTEFDKWSVHEMVLTPEKMKWYWTELQHYPSLFGTLDDNHMLSFVRKFTEPGTFWMEVYSQRELIGLIYLTDMWGCGAEYHAYFFDRKMADKVALCRHTIRWIIAKFRLHHLSMEVPSIYHATVRLAKNIGFRHEGTKRAVALYGNKWVDKVMFGLLSEEMI